MTDFEGLIHRLSEARVQFVVIGGFAGTLHGSPRVTVDLDLVYARDADNLQRLARALAPLSPYLRGAPPGLPFRLDAATATGVSAGRTPRLKPPRYNSAS
jgi:hypothetical protein